MIRVRLLHKMYQTARLVRHAPRTSRRASCDVASHVTPRADCTARSVPMRSRRRMLVLCCGPTERPSNNQATERRPSDRAAPDRTPVRPTERHPSERPSDRPSERPPDLVSGALASVWVWSSVMVRRARRWRCARQCSRRCARRWVWACVCVLGFGTHLIRRFSVEPLGASLWSLRERLRSRPSSP